MAELDPSSERALRARIIELERLLDARTQTIVGLGAQLAESRGERATVAADRKRQVAAIRDGLVARWESRIRRWYSGMRGQRG